MLPTRRRRQDPMVPSCIPIPPSLYLSPSLSVYLDLVLVPALLTLFPVLFLALVPADDVPSRNPVLSSPAIGPNLVPVLDPDLDLVPVLVPEQHPLLTEVVTR